MTAINRLTASAGLDWYKRGWDLFKRKPGMLVLMALSLFVIYFVLNLIPFGGLILAFVTPGLSGGYYLAIQRIETGEEPGFEHLFAAFTNPALRSRMFVLGAVSLGAQIAILLTMLAVFGGAFATVAGFAGPMTSLTSGFGGIGFTVFAILAGLVIALLLWIALFFAVPLVMLDGVEPAEALQTSLRANLNNLMAWLVFSLLLIPLIVLAVIPLGLGMLLLYPVMNAAMYAAYRQTFTHTALVPELP